MPDLSKMWDSEQDERLAVLWDALPRLSTAEIGRRLGKTKNAVVGRTRRTGLEPRPSPIVSHARFASEAERKAAWRVRKGGRPIPVPAAATLPALVSAAFPPIVLQAAPVIVQEVEMVTKPVAKRIAKYRGPTCQWPTNDGLLSNGRKGWLFCDAAAAPGKVYCVVHCAIAYNKGARRPRDG